MARSGSGSRKVDPRQVAALPAFKHVFPGLIAEPGNDGMERHLAGALGAGWRRVI